MVLMITVILTHLMNLDSAMFLSVCLILATEIFREIGKLIGKMNIAEKARDYRTAISVCICVHVPWCTLLLNAEGSNCLTI